MPRYNVPAGDLIDMLMEECSEVIQAIGKYRRFGPDGTKKWLDEDPSRETPRQQMITELGDVLGIVALMRKRNMISLEELDKAVDRKLAKLEDYFGLTTDALPPYIKRRSDEAIVEFIAPAHPDPVSSHYGMHGVWMVTPHDDTTRTKMYRHLTYGYVVYEANQYSRRAKLPLAPWTKEKVGDV